MPTANHHAPDFDDVQLDPAAAPALNDEESWFSNPAPAKKVKKKKGRKNVEPQFRPVEEEEDTLAFAKEVTPPSVAAPPPAAEEYDDEPVFQAEDKDWRYEESPYNRAPSLLDDDEALPVRPKEPERANPEPEQAEAARRPSAPPPPQTQPQPQPAASPRPSPRLTNARPVSGSYSPQRTPATLYTPPQQPAMPTYRGTNPVTGASRRESSSHTSPRPRFNEPVAPPHKPQPHFYGLPDLGLGFGQKQEQAAKAAGSDGYCCSFDSFADAADPGSVKRAKNVLLIGSEGGLEILRVLPSKFEVVGRLEGLRGSVIGAKVLPHTELVDQLQPLRPLVAVLVHGPIREDVQGQEKKTTMYQTSVEVYSLQSQQHVATLFTTAPVPLEQPVYGHLSTIPGPIGDLSIDAEGRFVTIASGKSGEIFVFSHHETSVNTEHEFRCIGKFWTSLQRPFDNNGSRPQSSSDGSGYGAEEPEEKPGVPLFSLSGRWLAYVTPSYSDHMPIQASPLLLEGGSTPPGLSSHLAPAQPPITCDVAGVDEEGAWTRLSRQAAQTLVKYSQRGVDMGLQGWKELTNPTMQTAQLHNRTASDERFPPTKAPPDDPRRHSKEPAIVSIVDLETLLDAEASKPKHFPLPLATFALEIGCNFLSLSSSGLRLLTVSRKGEISVIWNLSQSSHGVSKNQASSAEENENGPCIKQILRIPRSSQSVVVDCAWSRDDEYLATLTTHGTVHLHEIPAHPPRKRKRRSTITAPLPPDKAEPTVSLSPGTSPPSSNGGFLGSIMHQVSTQVSAARSQNPIASLGIPTSFAGFKETAANAGVASRRALAKGLSQGYSAARSGASEYWHSEDNKIRHKGLGENAKSGSLRWVRRPSGTSLAVACEGKVHLHPVQRIERMSGDVMVSGLKQDKRSKKTFSLPPIRTNNEMAGHAKKDENCASAGPHGFWGLKHAPPIANPTAPRYAQRPATRRAQKQDGYEVETNPPFVPVHIDPRVNIFAFDATSTNSSGNLLEASKLPAYFTQGQGDPNEEPWLPGEPLPPSTKLNVHEGIEAVEYRQGITDSEMEEAAAQVESRLTVMSVADDGAEQIQVHTRPKQGTEEDGGVEVLEDEDGDEFEGV